MKGQFLNKAFHTLTEAFQNCLKRFPTTVCFVLALTAYLAYLVSTEMDDEKKLTLVLGYYFSVGTLLSLTLHLWNEEIKNRIKGISVHIVMHVLLIADAVYLYSLSPERSLTEISIAHGAAILALWLSVFFLSFTKEKNDIPSWNFASYTVGAFVTANVVGLIMSGGISLLVFSLHQLFDVDVSWKCYLYILVVCSVLLPMLLFLGMLPKNKLKHNQEPQPSEFLNGTIHFLFLPLMAGCIAIEFGLYPSRVSESKRINEWIARWLPALVLPLLILMTVGIIRRFNDYGVTINRLYLITLNIWCYIVCFGLVLTRARRISWIPILFSIIFLLTSVLPVNYASITRNVMRRSIEKELARSGKTDLPLSRNQYDNWLDSLPAKTALQVNDRLRYLHYWFGRKSIADLVDKDASFYYAKNRFGQNSDETADNDKAADNNRAISYSAQASSLTSIEIPKGYSCFVIIPESSRQLKIPHKYIETGVLPASLGTRTDKMNDTAYIDLKNIKALQRYKYGEMPPAQFKCNSDKCLFILTGFSLDYQEEGNEALFLNINGYLFRK